MAYGIAKLVAQQYYKFHPNFTNFLWLLELSVLVAFIIV
jgi:hypothetical protein